MTPLPRLMPARLRRHPIRDYLLMTLGVVLTAFALDAFLIPNRLAAGGVSGLATVIYYTARDYGVTLPIGMQMLAMNLVLLVAAFVARGGATAPRRCSARWRCRSRST